MRIASCPPGYAGENPERRGVFDELISSAESVGPATRPLPLFYALSQAGRAIAAAHAAGAWRLRAHGLSATELSHPLLEMPIMSDPLQDSGPDVADSPSALAAATGSDMFTGSVSIGELWASLPELCDLLPEEPPIRPLLLVPEGPDPENIRIRLPAFEDCLVEEIDRARCLRFKATLIGNARELREAIAAGASCATSAAGVASRLRRHRSARCCRCWRRYSMMPSRTNCLRATRRGKRMRVRVPKPNRTFLEVDELAALIDAARAQDEPAREAAPHPKTRRADFAGQASAGEGLPPAADPGR